MIDKCKLAIALVLAAIAGLTAIAAGLMSEARISVILGRTLCSFLITGVLVYIGVFLFEKFGYDSLIKETEAAMAELKKAEKKGGAEEAEAEPQQEAEEAAENDEAEGERGFQPLQPESLRRVVGTEAEQ